MRYNPPSKQQIIEELAKALHSGRLTVFAGSGLTMTWGRPSWRNAALELLGQLTIHLEKQQTKISDSEKKGIEYNSTKLLESLDARRREDQQLQDAFYLRQLDSKKISSTETTEKTVEMSNNEAQLEKISGEIKRAQKRTPYTGIPTLSESQRRLELLEELEKEIRSIKKLQSNTALSIDDFQSCFSEAEDTCKNLDDIAGSRHFSKKLHKILKSVFGVRNTGSRDPYYLHILYHNMGARRFLTLNFDMEIERFLTSVYHSEADERELRSDIAFRKRLKSRLKSRRGSPTGGSFETIDNACHDPKAHALLLAAAIDRWHHDSFVAHLHGRIDSPASLVLADAGYRTRYHLSGDDLIDARQAQSLALTSAPLLFVGTALDEKEVLDPLRKLAAAMETRAYARTLIALLPSACLIAMSDKSGVHKTPLSQDRLDIAHARDTMHAQLLKEQHGVSTVFYGQFSAGEAKNIQGKNLFELALRKKLVEIADQANSAAKAQSTVITEHREAPLIFPILPGKGKERYLDHCFVRHKLSALHATGKKSDCESDPPDNDTPGDLQPSWYKRRLVQEAVKRANDAGLLKRGEAVYLVAGDPGAGAGRLYHTMHELAAEPTQFTRFFFASTAFSMEYASVMESLIQFLTRHLRSSADIAKDDRKALTGKRLKRYDFIHRLRFCLKLVAKVNQGPKFVIVLAGLERLMDNRGHFISADYRIALSSLMHSCHSCGNVRLAIICDIHEARIQTLAKMSYVAGNKPTSIKEQDTTVESVSRYVEQCRVEHYSEAQYLGQLIQASSKRPFKQKGKNKPWKLDAQYKQKTEQYEQYEEYKKSEKHLKIEEGKEGKGRETYLAKFEPPKKLIKAGIHRYQTVREMPAIESARLRCLMISPLVVDPRQWHYHSIYRVQYKEAWENATFCDLQGRWFEAESQLLQLFLTHGEVISSALIDMIYSQWLRLFQDEPGQARPWKTHEHSGVIELYLENFERLIANARQASSERCESLVFDFLIEQTPLAINAPALRTRMVFRLLALCAMPVSSESLLAYVIRYGGPAESSEGDVQGNDIGNMLKDMAHLSLIYQLEDTPPDDNDKRIRYAVGNGLRRHILSRLSGHTLNSGESNFFQSNLYNIFPRNLPNFDGQIVGDLLLQIEWYCRLSEEILKKETSYNKRAYCTGSAHLRTAFGVLRNTCSMAIVSRAYDQQPAWRENLGTSGVLDRFVSICERLINLTKKLQKMLEPANSLPAEYHPLHPDELVWLYSELGCAHIAKGNLYQAGQQLANVTRCGKLRPQSYSTILRNQLNQIRLMIERGKLDEARAALPAMHSLEAKIYAKNREIYGKRYRSDESNALCALEGWLAHLQADYDNAVAIYRKSMKHMAARGRHRFCAFLSRNLAEIHLERNDKKAALRAIRNGYRFAERGRDEEVHNHLRIVHALCYIRLGSKSQLNRANQMLELVEIYADRLGSERILSLVRLTLARQRIEQGNFAEAADFAGKSLALSSLGGLQLLKIRGLLALGESHLRKGATVSGRLLVTRAREMASRAGYFALYQSCDRLLSTHLGEESGSELS